VRGLVRADAVFAQHVRQHAGVGLLHRQRVAADQQREVAGQAGGLQHALGVALLLVGHAGEADAVLPQPLEHRLAAGIGPRPRAGGLGVALVEARHHGYRTRAGRRARAARSAPAPSA
jgi:hypothetical protein